MLLTVTDIHKAYGQVQVLKGVSIQIETGEVVALVGASGAGKSTLLQIIGTLDTADQGSVSFDGEALFQLDPRARARFRNEKMGFIFQFHHLLPEFSALENVCMPGWIADRKQDEVTAEATNLLNRLGVGHRLDHKPNQLSGGEQQRVSVARALINKPRLILADEPTGNLDTRNSEELYQLIFTLAKETGVTFLIATHNLGLAHLTHRVLRIQDGVMADA